MTTDNSPEKKFDFWALFKKSVVTQSILALLVLTTCCVLWLRAMPLPEELIYVAILILGFFFGSKVQNSINGK